MQVGTRIKVGPRVQVGHKDMSGYQPRLSVRVQGDEHASPLAPLYLLMA